MTEETNNSLLGDLIVADAVIAEIAGYAALESYGVVGMAAPSMQDGIAKILPMRKLQRGIVLHFDKDKAVTIDLFVIIENGTNLSAVSQNLASSVRYSVEHFTQIKVADVFIHVQGIHIKRTR